MICYTKISVNLFFLIIILFSCSAFSNVKSKKHDEKYILSNCGKEYFVDKELFVKKFDFEGPVFVNPIISSKLLDGIDVYENIKNILYGKDNFFYKWTYFGELHEQCNDYSWGIMKYRKNKFNIIKNYKIDSFNFSGCCKIHEDKNENGSGSVYIIRNKDFIVLRYNNDLIYRIIIILKLSSPTNITIEAEKNLFKRIKNIKQLDVLMNKVRDLIDCLILNAGGV